MSGGDVFCQDKAREAIASVCGCYAFGHDDGQWGARLCDTAALTARGSGWLKEGGEFHLDTGESIGPMYRSLDAGEHDWQLVADYTRRSNTVEQGGDWPFIVQYEMARHPEHGLAIVCLKVGWCDQEAENEILGVTVFPDTEEGRYDAQKVWAAVVSAGLEAAERDAAGAIANARYLSPEVAAEAG